MLSPGPVTLVNLRDVGGLPTVGGGRVAAGQLFRSAAPLEADAEPDLRAWPPRTVIDLRAPGESVTGRHPLDSPTTDIIVLPLTRDLDPARMAAHDPARPVPLSKIYARIVRDLGSRLADIVAVVATSPGPVLVHCAAGKDRTGIAMAVALAGVGVRHEAIVEDYRRTEAHVDALSERVALSWAPGRREAWRRLVVERPELLRAPAAAIEEVLMVLTAWEGGAEGWLVDHGLAPETLDALRRRLITPPGSSGTSP